MMMMMRTNPMIVAAMTAASGGGRRSEDTVIEINRRRNRVILSERAAMAEHRKEQKDKILDELNEGDIREGTISSITDFGVFVDLGGADGLAHMTELTWERGKKAKDIYNVGDPVKAYILKVDRETKKISLSLKRAQPEKWDGTVGRFVIGQILIGRVTKLMAFGAFVRLDGPVEGLIHISELSSRRIQHPKEVVKEGDVVPVKLVRIERDRHRLGLSLRQARSDAEAMGFVFDHLGMVIDYPDDVREQFQLPPRDKSLKARTEPRTAQEAVANAVARDPEPVSAFAHAFQQALENAEASNTLATAEPEDVTPVAEAAVGEAVTVADAAIDQTPVAEVMTGEAAPVAEAMDDEAAPVAEVMTDEAAPVAEVMTDAETVPTAEIMTGEAAPVAEVITDEAPVPEAVVEEAPVAEAAVEEAPVAEAAVEEAPVAEAVVEEAPVAEAVVEEAPVPEAVVEEVSVAEAAVEEVSAAEETTSIAEARAEVVDQPEVAVEAVAEPVATTEDTPPASAEAPDAPGDTEPEAAVAEAGDASDAQEGDAPRER